MALDQQLLEILACPDTHHAPLDHDADAQTLTCTECGRIFPIRDDIPILLLDEAISPPTGPADSPEPAEAGGEAAGSGEEAK
ncbi:Trm112 family protein [Actinoplanes sp. NPDC024001]|uniref:Trm112 family protein n=1 Tax=Actinoplanes sp. NPDC024001 TaxID=3154598 RepID=UPI0033D1C73B